MRGNGTPGERLHALLGYAQRRSNRLRAPLRIARKLRAQHRRVYRISIALA
jgi:hypothetical protein